VFVWKNEFLEGKTAEGFGDMVATDEDVLLAAHGHRGLLGVDVEDHAGRGGDAGLQPLAHGR